MRISRIFVATGIMPGSPVALDNDAAHYLSRVLRARTGDRVVLFDGSGADFPARIETIDRKRVVCSVVERVAGLAEPPVAITLVQGISRGEKMDLTIQKATELGAAAIRPVLTERGVVRLPAERAAARAAHWRKVAVNACQQCGRSVVPAVAEPSGLADALQSDASRVRLMALPDAQGRLGETLADIATADSISLLIGPEGGFSGAEIEAALAAGVRPFRAGPRVLRTETAAIALLAILQHAAGDLG
jgi:16S rRNA (uracil1498-N3)-methyltransferase